MEFVLDGIGDGREILLGGCECEARREVVAEDAVYCPRYFCPLDRGDAYLRRVGVLLFCLLLTITARHPLLDRCPWAARRDCGGRRRGAALGGISKREPRKRMRRYHHGVWIEFLVIFDLHA